MSDDSGIPVLFPDSVTRVVPQNEVAGVVSQGGQLAQKMETPDNVTRWVPFDDVHEIIRQGGRIIPPLPPPPSAPRGLQGVPSMVGQPVPDSERGIVPGVGRAVSGLAQLPGNIYHAVADAPKDEDEAALHDGASAQHPAAGQLMLALKRLVVDPAVASWQRGNLYEEKAKTEDPEQARDFWTGDQHMANMQHLAALIPLLGPFAANLTERALHGDPTGAATELASNVVAGEAIKQGVKAVKGAVGPRTTEVAGEQIPVRASQESATAAQAERLASQPQLRRYAARETQPSVRKAIAKTTAAAYEVPGAEGLPPTSDAFGFGKAADALRDRSQPVFQRLDALSEGEFTKAQAKARAALRMRDFDAYESAQATQQAIFDQFADEFQGDTLPKAKLDWRRSSALDSLATRFNRSIHATPEGLLAKGEQDYGYINARQFREAVIDAEQKGELDKAGFTGEQIGNLETFGRLLEKANTVKKFSALTRHILRAGLAGATGHATTALETFGGTMAVEAGVGAVLGRIMTSPDALNTLIRGLTAGQKLAPLAQAINYDLSRAEDRTGDDRGRPSDNQARPSRPASELGSGRSL
jgi:hypothetical protein